jgi:hypothetical protein
MTRLVILVMLAACGDEPADTTGIHSLTTCDVTTSQPGEPCERGCATHHEETGIGCAAHSDQPPPNGTDVSCEGTFGLDGVIGCCVVLPDTIVLRFVECQ